MLGKPPNDILHEEQLGISLQDDPLVHKETADKNN